LTEVSNEEKRRWSNEERTTAEMMGKSLIITSQMVLDEEKGGSLRGRLQLIDFYRKHMALS
jgi:hypothetical protein